MNLSLNGSWKLSGSTYENIDATVPGCIHTDLLNSGLIEDPFYRDNELKYMYLGECDWTYERYFDVPSDLLKFNHVMLNCYGLDTFAAISINGKKIIKTNNQFRTWKINVKDYIHEGDNHIRIKFYSTFPYIKEKTEEHNLRITGTGHHRLFGGNYVRKSQCNYGWDWGPKCVTAGIWRKIELEAYNISLSDIRVNQKHMDHEVELELLTTLTDIIEKADHKDYKIKAALTFDGEMVDRDIFKVNNKSSEGVLVVKHPKKWWPNNLGQQNLYELSVTLLYKGEIIDSLKQKIGLRTLVLDRQPDEYGESFRFVVNSIPFFAKGANWIPIDTFTTRKDEHFYREILESAKASNMNFIRVWGGGIYEEDVFYDLCDELGLCVWQDFMFACSAYPAYDKAYMDTVKEEVKDNVIRIRNHPSLALWCGNNEIEYMGNMISDDGKDGTMTWEEYKYMFDEFIPDTMKEYDSMHSYWASSPMDGSGEHRGDGKSPERGDAHLWDVWHGLKPFEWYRTCDHRFNSEFGFQSFPEPDVVKSYTQLNDRNISSSVMEHHQRSGIGNSVIIHYMLSWFKLPTSFEHLMWTSQILQSLAIKYAVENWRRKMPRGMGTLYWQLNDVWPGPSWSSIDSFGNWKALHYSAKKFYNPILVSGIEDKENKTLKFYLSNDTLEDVSGVIQWQNYSLSGDLISSGAVDSRIGALSSKEIKTVSFAKELASAITANRMIITYQFVVKDKVLSENTSYFEYPKHMMLEKPKFEYKFKKLNDYEIEVVINSDKPALWVWMDVEADATYSDRFFDLFPGQSRTIVIKFSDHIEIEDLAGMLCVQSIFDTYQ